MMNSIIQKAEDGKNAGSAKKSVQTGKKVADKKEANKKQAVQVAVFENPEFGTVRTATDEKGEPWFCAKNLCDVLGYKNSSCAVNQHVRSSDVAKRYVARLAKNRFGVCEGKMQVVQMICNKVAVMENGKVVESGSVLDVFGKPQALVTKRFVQTVINDQIPESIVSLVKEQKEHFQVERLKFIGSSVKRPVISDICQVEGIVVNILGATVQELQENVMCVFILQLIGSEDKICEAEKQIDANGVIRERVEVI